MPKKVLGCRGLEMVVSACACLRLTSRTVQNSDDKRKEKLFGKRPAQKLCSQQQKLTVQSEKKREKTQKTLQMTD